MLFVKLLLLLWFVNFAPPLLAHFLEDRWDAPVDGGRRFSDGEPWLGPHKTLRGVVAATLVGALVGFLFGFPVWVGLLTGVLSMAGDLLSSFIKRRLKMVSGNTAPGLDQLFEGFLPFAVLAPYGDLGWGSVTALVGLFSLGAYGGSWFFNEFLRKQPFHDYPRPLRSQVRLREFRSCQVTGSRLHHLINFEDSVYYHIFMKSFFQLLGLYEQGKSNALELEECRVEFAFPDLPGAFDGYTILFLTDLHLDGLDGLSERLEQFLKRLPVDLCIIGGDLRMETHGPFEAALTQLRRLIPEIRAKDGILGVLGNHDCLEIVMPLEAIGIHYLVNEALALERDGQTLWVVGVDDPHYYQCHDLERAFSGVPKDAFTIFVAHSNEIYREAADYGPKLYLCGHTHAGQIQFPWVGPVFTHSRAPRRLCHGHWRHNGMLGYTSCGVGVSGVPVRFASKGEVTVVTLKKA